MNKTNPIGVRFRADLLEKLKTDHGIESPQKALVFYERFFVTWSHLGKEINTALRDKTKQSGQKEAGKPIVSDLTQPTSVLKPQEQPKTKFEAAISEAAQKAIREQIEAIRAEKIPKERDTPFGRKSWQIDQQKRIQDLQSKLS